MKAWDYVKGLLTVSFALMVVSGCSSFLNINERAMTAGDVINMTKAGVGPDVITRQIEVTRSRFKLDTDQIIQLKEAGVDDKVLKAMIETEDYPGHIEGEFGYSPYEYWFNYYNQWYPVYHYYPYSYPSYYYSPYAYPYSVYRRSDLIGRFYRYVPLYPPQWDYQRHNWIMPGEEIEKEEEK